MSMATTTFGLAVLVPQQHQANCGGSNEERQKALKERSFEIGELQMTQELTDLRGRAHVSKVEAMEKNRNI